MTVTQSSLAACHSVPGTVRNLKNRVVERLSCFLTQSSMIAADGVNWRNQAIKLKMPQPLSVARSTKFVKSLLSFGNI